MSRRRKAIWMLAVTAAALGGCQSAPQEARDQAVALAMLGPAVEQEPAGSFRLGAGDALGRDLYAVYVASIDDDLELILEGGAIRPH